MEAFAKKLVSSDGAVRERAFRGLSQWLETRAAAAKGDALSERDALRLWKALFYCMWMADRPAYQLALAQRLGDVGAGLHESSPQAAATYALGFWRTLVREWPGLDRHRLDKYYNVVRRFLALGLELLAASGYSADVARMHADVLGATLFSPERSACPDGLRLFALEALPDIAAKVLTAAHGAASVPEAGADAFLALLAPLHDMLARTPSRVLLDAAGRDYFPGAARALARGTAAALGRAAFSRGEGAVYGERNRAALYAGGLLLQASEAEQ